MSKNTRAQFARLAIAVAISTTSALAGTTLYPDNRAPLQEKPFTALPLGSVQAKGWLLRQLELQRDGLTGHAEQAIPQLDASNGWLGGNGENWEKGPYYVKGLVPLAYTLNDDALKKSAQKWVEWALSSQQTNGFFGPKSNNDWWPRMVATYFLRDYAEATGDARVAPHLTRYYHYMAAELPRRPLGDWSKARAGDEMDTIFWLYNRTGDAFLLELADLIKKQAYDWTGIYTGNHFLDSGGDMHPKHNVNVPQAAKFPSVYWQRSGSEADRQALYAGRQHLMRDHGTSFGINTGTEFLAGTSSGQGVEFCSIVEKMLSDETTLRIFGDVTFGDQVEQLAFNALPAAWTKDIRGFQYYTVANEVTATRGPNGFMVDYDDGFLPGPHSGCHCCCYNVHMGWPKLAQNSWAATSQGGLAVMAYVPSRVKAKVAKGSEVEISEETNYPFEEQIQFKISAAAPVKFPLQLRLPAWCKKPVVKVNGKRQSDLAPGHFYTISRAWKQGDVVTVELPMEARVAYGVNNSAHVEYGPLVFSMPIAEKWTATTNVTGGFYEFEVTPTAPWNYALAFDPQKPASSFKVVRRPLSGQPFSATNSPLQLIASARKLPTWGLAWNGRMAFDPPYSPLESSEPLESITLTPFGASTLRVTDFPWIGKSDKLTSEFKDDFNDGNSIGWVIYGSTWMVKDSQFVLAPGAVGYPWLGQKAVASATFFTDFVYEADVAVGPKGNAGLIFRVNKPSIGADAYEGYYASISAEDQTLALGRAEGYSFKQLGKTGLKVDANKMMHLKIIAHGAEIKVFADNMDESKLTASDAVYRSGSIGVREFCADQQNMSAAFDNISVKAQ